MYIYDTPPQKNHIPTQKSHKSPERALHFHKRAYSLHKRAIYLRNRALHLLKRATYLLKEPCISAKEPCISTKEPCFPVKEPYVPQNDPPTSPQINKRDVCTHAPFWLQSSCSWATWRDPAAAPRWQARWCENNSFPLNSAPPALMCDVTHSCAT